MEESSWTGSTASWEESTWEHDYLKARRILSEPEDRPFFVLGGTGAAFSEITTPFPLFEEGQGGGTEDRDGVEVEEPEGTTGGSLGVEELGRPRLRPKRASSSSSLEVGENIFSDWGETELEATPFSFFTFISIACLRGVREVASSPVGEPNLVCATPESLRAASSY